MSRVITSTRNINEVYERFAGLVRALVPADRIVISIQLDDGKSYETAYVSGLEVPGWNSGSAHPVQGTVMGQVAVQMRSLLVVDIRQSEFAGQYGYSAALVKTGVRSSIAVPLIFQGVAVGALGVMSTTPGAYTDGQVSTVEKIAAQIAGAVVNARLAARLEREAEERQALVEIGRTVSSSLDIRAVFDEFVRQTLKVVPADRIGIVTLDPGEQTLVIRCAWGPSLPERQQGHHYPVKGSLAGLSATERRTVILDDSNYEQVHAQMPQMSRMRDMGFRSLIVTPLITGDRASGALTVSSMRPFAYGPSAAAFLERVALQIAGPVENGILHEQAKREADEREVLAEIGRVITSTPDVKQVYEAFAAQLARLIKFDRVTVSLIDEARDTVTRPYVAGKDVVTAGPGSRGPFAGSLEQKVVEGGTAVVLSVGDIRDYPNGPQWVRAGFKSLMSTPLVVSGKAIGTLGVSSVLENAFSSRDSALFGRVASQIAGSIANAWLNAAFEHDSIERKTIAEIGRLISSTLRIEDVYPLFVRQVIKLIPSDRIVISVFDEHQTSSIDAYMAGTAVPGFPPGGRFPISGTVFEELIATKKRILISAQKMSKLAEAGSASSRNALSAGLQSMLITPLIWQDRVVGSLNFRSREDSPYTNDLIALAEQISAQIAGAVVTSRLYAEAKREADTRQALATIGVAASRDLDLGKAFDAVADELAKLIKFDRISVTLLDPDTGDLRVAFGRGIQIPGKEVGALVQAVRDAGWQWRSEMESSLSHQPDGEALARLGLSTRMQVSLGAPASGLIGYLGLWSCTKDAYTQADLDLLQRVAAQITPAIQNALVHRRSLQLAEAREKATQLEAQTRELSRVNEIKSQFLTTVSHELKTPLTSIMAFTDLISRDRDRTLTEKQRHQLELVRRNARQLSALINELLDISKIESGKLELRRHPFGLSDLLRETAESFMPVLAARGQKLVLDVNGSDLPVLGDRERVMQVVSNLLSNASKYSPEGRSISLRAADSGDYISITVKDSGIGISKADQVHLFTPFFRADNSLTRTVSGSGLGLAIVRRLVEMHGGTVSVESDSGAGTEFTVRLPRSINENDDA